MPSFLQRPLMRRCRLLFRWCRIVVWLMVFCVIATVAYLHLVGLPDYVKRPMLRRLEAQGITARFSNMQLGWGRGPSIIIEDAAFSRYHQTLSPILSAQRAELTLRGAPLLRGQLDVRSLLVSEARLKLPVSDLPGDELLLKNVALDLQFFTNDIARLAEFRGMFSGVQIEIAAGVNHASELRHWQFPLGGRASTNGAFQARLRQIAGVVKQIHFAGVPVLQIEAGADGRDMDSFHAEMNFLAAAAFTPWAAATNLFLSAACSHLARPGATPFFDAHLSASNIVTRWAKARTGQTRFIVSRPDAGDFHAEVRVDATRLAAAGTNPFAAARLGWVGSATLAYSNFIPLQATGRLRLNQPQTPWGLAQEISFDGLVTPSGLTRSNDPALGPWNFFVPWQFVGQTEVRNAVNPKFRFARFALTGKWRAPLVSVETAHGELYGGAVDASASLDVRSRELNCRGTTDFNPHAVSPLLTPAARDWLDQLDWVVPPRSKASLYVVLPPWTNRPENWRAAMGDTLELAGDFTATNASFRHALAQSAAGHVSYTNRTWHISGLHAVRPDGEATLDYTSGHIGYRYIIDSRMNPRAGIPLLPPGHEHVLDKLEFKEPPRLHAEIWGAWHAKGSLGFTADIHASNFIAHGQPVNAFNTRLEYTNLVLTAHDLFVSNQQGFAQVPLASGDLTNHTVTLANMTGNLDPALLETFLHTNHPAFIDLLHFDYPPHIAVSGSFSTTNPNGVNLHFLVNGQGMHYENLSVDQFAGVVDWIGPNIAITNISASLYNNGSVMGQLKFTTHETHHTDFNAKFAIRDIDLHSLIAGVTHKPSRVEGRLDGDITVGGPGSDKQKWRGSGDVHVHDALLWDIKLFGLLSPVLNSIAAGSGQSRARDAKATFVIKDGGVTSEDLDIRSTAFRVHYRGTVKMNKEINARVEAALLRDLPLLGRVVSLVLKPFSKLFEYSIKGTLKEPVMEPVFVPKFLVELMHPIKSLKNAAGNANTAPPAPPEKAK